MIRKLLRFSNKVAFLLPAATLLILLALAVVIGQSITQHYKQAETLNEIATHDTILRKNAITISNTAAAINTRLLGVLSDTYSMSGSVITIERFYSELEGAWKSLASQLTPQELQGFAAIIQKKDALFQMRHGLIEALRSSERSRISRQYDQFLEAAVPLQRLLDAKAQELDNAVTNKIADVSRASEAGLQQGITLSALAVLIGLATTAYSFFGVGRPLSRVSQIIARLHDGDVTTVIPKTRRNDEIGALMLSLERFRHSLSEAQELRSRSQEVTQAAEAERKALLERLIGDLEKAVNDIVNAIGRSSEHLGGNALTMRNLAERTAKEAHSVNDASASTTQGLHSVAAATSQLNISIEEIGSRVSSSATIAETAFARVSEANQVIDKLDGAINDIGTVLGLIRSIAEQTNLLALNATIEAARAGEAGRGFAVVAAEVKTLATQTTRATDEIAAQIQAVRMAGADVIGVVETIRQAVDAVNAMSMEISSSVHEQQHATGEISNRIALASGEAERIAHSIAQVLEAAKRTDTQASAVSQAIEEISHQATRLRSQIDSFIAQSKAA